MASAPEATNSSAGEDESLRAELVADLVFADKQTLKVKGEHGLDEGLILNIFIQLELIIVYFVWLSQHFFPGRFVHCGEHIYDIDHIDAHQQESMIPVKL